MRRRRWLRFAIPFGLALLVTLTFAGAYLYQQPSHSDESYLSPVYDGGTGASRLAGMLRQQGVEVERVTKTSDALVSATGGGGTIFMPTPDLVHPFYLRMLKLLPAGTRLVVIEPSARTATTGNLPVVVADRRLVARPVAPGCALTTAREAGVAGIGRSVFVGADGDEHCYGGSLVIGRINDVETTTVGAADPFRNDRIDEHGNARLAVGLLATAPRVIWLDLHRREPPPGLVDDPALANQPAAPPSLGPGTPDPDFALPGGDNPAPDLPQGRGEAADGRDNPLSRAFPPWLYPVVALLAVAAVLLALARARRLGTPITEPLPVRVRGTETVLGRGRLYQRARARGSALRTLQAGARQRIARLLNLGADVTAEHLCAAAALHSGWSEARVRETLFQAQPHDDAELITAATAIESLLHAVMNGPGTGSGAGSGAGEETASE